MSQKGIFGGGLLIGGAVEAALGGSAGMFFAFISAVTGVGAVFVLPIWLLIVYSKLGRTMEVLPWVILIALAWAALIVLLIAAGRILCRRGSRDPEGRFLAGTAKTLMLALFIFMVFSSFHFLNQYHREQHLGPVAVQSGGTAQPDDNWYDHRTAPVHPVPCDQLVGQVAHPTANTACDDSGTVLFISRETACNQPPLYYSFLHDGILMAKDGGKWQLKPNTATNAETFAAALGCRNDMTPSG